MRSEIGTFTESEVSVSTDIKLLKYAEENLDCDCAERGRSRGEKGIKSLLLIITEITELLLRVKFSKEETSILIPIEIPYKIGNTALLGRRVQIGGFFYQSWNSMMSKIRLDVGYRFQGLTDINFLEKTQNFQIENFLTDSEPEIPHELLQMDLGLRNKLIKSFCPQIKQMYYLKLALLLQKVSKENFLYKKEIIKGKINILLVGTLLSTKLRAMFHGVKILDTEDSSSIYLNVSDLNSSKEAGIKIEKGSIESRAFFVKKNPVLLLPNFQKLQTKRLEDLKLLLGKKSSLKTLNSTFGLLASCQAIFPGGVKYNNKKWEETMNTGLSPHTLSIFDLIIDIEEQEDSSYEDRQLQFTTYVHNGQGKLGAQLLAPWELAEQLRSSAELSPRLSPRAYSILVDYMKFCEEREALLLSLIKLTLAHAKLVGRVVAVCSDAILVVGLMECMRWERLVEKPAGEIIMKNLKQYVELEEKILKGLEKKKNELEDSDDDED